MELATQADAYKEQTELEKDVTHAVKQALKAFPVFHAPWVIMIERVKDTQLKVYAFLPENTTLPHGLSRPEQPIAFRHTSYGTTMERFTDVAFFPIARELAKEMTKAYKQGTEYGRIP